MADRTERSIPTFQRTLAVAEALRASTLQRGEARIAEFAERGFAGLLAKPFEVEELLDTMRRCLD